MEQPTLIINRLRQQLDEKCRQILDIVVLRGAYESDAIRFNELFRIVKPILEISKPTFNDHINHLIQKKLIKRKRIGKQETRLYLNAENPKIVKLKETKLQVDRDTITLVSKMKEQETWTNMPTLLAMTFSVLELRRVKIILEYFLSPEKANENILAMAYQAKRQEELQNLILGGAAVDILAIKDLAKRKIVKNKMIGALDQAITKMQNALSNLSKKQ